MADPERRRRRRKPAYPKPGTGEDYPARRQGTKIGEHKSGQQKRQPTRASAAHKSTKKQLFSAYALPPARGRSIDRAPLWRGGKPSGKRKYPFSHGIKSKPTKDDPWRI